MSEEGNVPNIPNLELCEYVFVISCSETSKDEKQAAVASLLQAVEADEMAPYLSKLMSDPFVKPYLDENVQTLHASLEQKNKDQLAKLEEKLEDATTNLGETEVSDTLRSRALYYAKIGDKEKALEAYEEAFKKQAGIGSKIDLRLGEVRIGFFYQDHNIVTTNLQKAEELINQGGDWDRRNRLKAYQGLHSLSLRDFKKASELFLDILPTFTATELFSYRKFVEYSIITGTLCLPRRDIKKRVIEAPEVIQSLSELPYLQNFTKSLYDSQYALFFRCLAEVEEHHLLKSGWLFPHARYYVREMRIKAYAQLLESYRSLTLANLADSFGVNETFMDNDLSRFIAGGRLNCSIDKVNGIVETNRPDSKNALYEQAIKQGDILLNNIQKLSRVVGT